MNRTTILNRWRDRILATPHHVDRIAAGVMGGAALLPPAILAAVEERAAEIEQLRRERVSRRDDSKPRLRQIGWHILRRYHRGILWGRPRGRRMTYQVTRENPPVEGVIAYDSVSSALRMGACDRRVSPRTTAHRFSRRVWWINGDCTLEMHARLTRQSVAAFFRRQRSARPMVGHRLTDNGLAGVRLLRILPNGQLQSPQQQTLWQGPSLVASQWDTDSACRDASGIHALWPPCNLRVAIEAVAKRLAHYMGCDLSGDEAAYALVGGYGRYVIGTDGWRAEQQVLQALYVPTARQDEVARRYPEVPTDAID